MGAIIAKIAPYSSLSQFYPPASSFEAERDIPDLTGKIIIVTGGNAGIGYLTVKHLLLKNAKVYLAARSPTKCAEAVKRLREETGGKEPIFLQLDLANLPSVRKAAQEFLSKEERLDILFNNAEVVLTLPRIEGFSSTPGASGVMTPPLHLLTAQGYDLQFGQCTNVLGHYFFTILLLPAMERSTIHHKAKARVISNSSVLHEFAPGATGLLWKSIKGGAERDKGIKKLGPAFLPPWRLYGASKIGNIYLSNILTRYHGDIIVSCALHPGVLRTDLFQNFSFWERVIMGPFFRPMPLGPLTQLWGGTALEAEGISGKYLIPWARLGKADPRTGNEKTQDELKAWLEEQVKGF